MKNQCAKGWAMVTGVLSAIGLNSVAAPMIPYYPAVVTVQATSPLASEPGNNPAVFTFSRSGSTNSALTVPLTIGGSATNGVDYVAITNSISLAAGQTSTNIVITPIDEPSARRYKTIVLSLHREHSVEPLETASFRIGSRNRAVAYIAYNYTNVPPSVSIVTPINDRTFYSLPNIEIAANASDSNGWVTSVEFLANATSLGLASNRPVASGLPFALMEHHSGRFQFVWTNVPPGNYSLTAVATDNAGLQTTSSAIAIIVTTNLPTPIVRLVNPPADTVFPDLAPINIYAAAAETNGVINKVEFLANGQSLGVATNYLAAEPSSQFHLRVQWLPYFFRWTNAPAGSNILTAIATDNNGAQAVSDPVSIVVSTNVRRFRH